MAATVGRDSVDLAPLGSVTFAVEGRADHPATFTTVSGGVFEAGLSSITVAMDRRGRAPVGFVATLGVTGTVDIVASSPGCRGTLGFTVYLQSAAERAEAELLLEKER